MSSMAPRDLVDKVGVESGVLVEGVLVEGV